MKAILFITLFMGLLLQGCKFSASVNQDVVDSDTGTGGSTGSDETQFEIQITNLTFNQTFSEASFIFHKEALPKEWTLSQPIKSSLEELCEIGNSQKWLNDALINNNVYKTFASTQTESHKKSTALTFTLASTSDIYLTWANMLVNTNDGMTGSTHIQLDDLAVDESKSFDTNAFDCGSEFNSETPSTLSGPHGDQSVAAKATSAFNVNDEGFLSIHRGLITSSDGLANSVFDQSHFFNNPVASITIKRLK
ncbi:spondin domain-containing protein [bacterium]|nr:spondin domain-containing protein [bacterium]